MLKLNTQAGIKSWPCISLASNSAASLTSSSQVQKETEQRGRRSEFERNSVGWRSEDKGRMDRCWCQDLSAVTNGCCKDEASKTLENSDVVNHRYECARVCLCVWFVCARLCFLATVWVTERESVCVRAYVCVCLRIGVSQVARCQPWQRPSKMGEWWEIDLGGVWERQRWISVSDYRRKIANTMR